MMTDTGSGAITIGLVVLIGIGIYLIPTFVALARHHHQDNAILVLNVLTGWTVLGWLIALVWSLTAVQNDSDSEARVPCPYCDEAMSPRAIVCPSCRRDMPDAIVQARRVVEC